MYVYTRRSIPEVFCKKGILENLTKFTEKHQCWSIFFNKVGGLRRSKRFCYSEKLFKIPGGTVIMESFFQQSSKLKVCNFTYEPLDSYFPVNLQRFSKQLPTRAPGNGCFQSFMNFTMHFFFLYSLPGRGRCALPCWCLWNSLQLIKPGS